MDSKKVNAMWSISLLTIGVATFILAGANVILLEGIRLSEVPEGVYFLNAAPLNLSGADGSPCRAVLIAFEK